MKPTVGRTVHVYLPGSLHEDIGWHDGPYRGDVIETPEHIVTQGGEPAILVRVASTLSPSRDQNIWLSCEEGPRPRTSGYWVWPPRV